MNYLIQRLHCELLSDHPFLYPLVVFSFLTVCEYFINQNPNKTRKQNWISALGSAAFWTVLAFAWLTLLNCVMFGSF
jgi:hypothetical protein